MCEQLKTNFPVSLVFVLNLQISVAQHSSALLGFITLKF